MPRNSSKGARKNPAVDRAFTRYAISRFDITQELRVCQFLVIRTKDIPMIRVSDPHDTLAIVLAILRREIRKHPEATAEELYQAMPERLREGHPNDCRRLARNLVEGGAEDDG